MSAITLVIDASGTVVDALVGVLDPAGFPAGTTFADAAACPPGAGIGWHRDAGGTLRPPGYVPMTPAMLLAYANTRRKEIIEGKGGALGRLIQVPIASGTYPVPIDATTRAALGDAAFQTTLPADKPYEIPDWLLPTGEFIVLDAPGIMTFALAVRDAFQAVFTAQNQAFAGIRAGTVTTTAQVDAILGG